MRDPQQAAKKVGLQNGIELLWQRKVQTQLKKLQKLMARESAAQAAKLGLCRILFSSPEVEGEADGFALEKVGTGKTQEYKFWDKLKACELLLKLEEMDASCKENSFSGILEALQQGAQRSGEDEREADEE